MTSLAFSPDGTRLVSGSLDKTIKLWRVETGQLLATFESRLLGTTYAPASSRSGNRYSFPGDIGGLSVAFSPDAKRILSGSSDGTVKIWNVASGQSPATFFNLPNGEWLTMTDAGFFASSANGAEMVSVVQGFDLFSVMQFYEYLYHPELVEQNLKGDPEGRYANAKFTIDLGKILDSGPAPQIDQVGEVERFSSAIRMTVRITDKGGGMQKVIWRVNNNVRGDIVYFDQKKPATGGNYQVVTQTFQINPAIRNIIEITAYNSAGRLASEPFHREIDKFGEAKERPRMYILSVGVSNYANQDWHLDYAAGDAKSFGDTLKAAASGLYAEPRLIYLPNEQATIAGIEAAMNKLQGEVRADDVFVMFLAGHGRSIEGRYYFLPQNLQPGRGQTIMQDGISEDILQKWLRLISANNSVLIIDTCESAGAARGSIEVDTAIDRLEHAVGRSVIAAASGPAFEGYLGHGVMSYVILQTLTKSTGKRDELISLKDLEKNVKEQVPKISKDIWAVRQEPRTKTGDDFPLGQPVAMQPAEPTIPKSPNAALLRSERLRTLDADDAPVSRILDMGTQVRIVTIVGKWALVARDGQKLGYVPQDSLLNLQ